MKELEFEGAQYQNQLENRYQQLLLQLAQNQKVITYYKEEGKNLSEQLIQQAQRSFQEGEIDFLQFVQLIENSRGITLQYLQSLHAFQLTILEINYLIN